ncbi:hypothetical protein SUGI_0607260 [Cryptomeria japonica]|nr:hypothetical protein SUGI_0607260 [Cryptomeria japonica]
MKAVSYRQAWMIACIFIWAVARLLLENVSHSQSSPSVDNYERMHDRFPEVEEHCASVASEASLRLPHSNWRLPKELAPPLSGEWEQEIGSAPLLPLHFQQQDKSFKMTFLSLYPYYSDSQSATNTKLMNVTAFLCFHMSKKESNIIDNKIWEGFENQPGATHHCINLQGIYAESNSGNEKLCMLGRSKVALRQSNATATTGWDWSASPLVEDDKFLLHLQIPPNNGLTTRKIVGRLTSLRASDHPLFFDPVDITFPLDHFPYKFITDSMVESACNSRVHEKKPVDLELYQGKYQHCGFFRSILKRQILKGIPNWQCKGPVEYCNRVGPFSDQGGFSNSRILIQGFECFRSKEYPDVNVSAAIRVLPAQEQEHDTESSRLISVMWIQGTWRKASPGEICMVGCLASTPAPACDFQVCLYIPKAFSLKQRNLMLGFISSIRKDSGKALYPLSFEYPIQSDMSLPLLLRVK